jgi:alpha-galactosidase
MQVWRLDDARQSLVLASRENEIPQVIHWGARLPDDEPLEALALIHMRDITGGMIDAEPPLSLCPVAGTGFPGQPGLVGRAQGGDVLRPRFHLVEARTPPNALEFRFSDPDSGLSYEAVIRSTPETHVLELSATLRSEQPIILDWLAAPVLPASDTAREMIDFAGRWCGEFKPVHTPWNPGARLRDNPTGRTGHEHFPALLVPALGATNTQGEVWGLHYGWSGGHRMVAEELPDGRRQIQFGNASGSETQARTRFETATLYATYAPQGINGVATAFQAHVRERIVSWPRPDAPRPVHYNCWEAIYFDHDVDTLKDIATRAAALGAERFILDDGWFGARDDDTSSLGDWDVDPRKFPDGLGPLIAHIEGLGLRFGLWFEPEMVNPRSKLFDAHPDWALGHPDQPLGRNQLVLDMSREDVRAYLFDKISAVLSAHPIDYIKWDHNRVLPAPDAAQTRGTYALIDQLRSDFPTVEIESCASGGGRIDFGMLARTQRVWLSDSNDALERLKIQSGAAIFLPSCVTGSHVGPRVCHTSGRILDIRFRAWVAAQRHMGFEMDPRELTDEEARVLTEITAWWKANRRWMHTADILMLDSLDPSIIAEKQLARDGARFVVFAGRTDLSDQIAPRPLRLTGLDPDARYRVTLRNRDDAPPLSRGSLALKEGPVVQSGQALMCHGLALPWSLPASMWVLEGERL